MIFNWLKTSNQIEQEETFDLVSRVNTLIDEIVGPELVSGRLYADKLLPAFLKGEEREYAYKLVFGLLDHERTLVRIELDETSYDKMDDSDRVRLREHLRVKERALKRIRLGPNLISRVLSDLIEELYEGAEIEETSDLFVPLSHLNPNFLECIDRLVENLLCRDMREAEIFNQDRARLTPLVFTGTRRKLPSEVGETDPDKLIKKYFAGTPYVPLFKNPIPYGISDRVRVEHTQIVAGSGHGKTELMKTLILSDFEKALEDGRSVLVIDSQGDMLSSILRQSFFDPDFGPLADRLVIIDPNDLTAPPALNLFALGTEAADPLTKEKKIQSAVALYEYLFGSLLGAELTQRQGALFSFLARLMIEIPGANIHTLRDLLQGSDRYKSYIARLPPTAREFFQTRFSHPSFSPVKTQILNRLWGILASGPLDRMFSNREMRFDFGSAFQEGKIILVHTAKELLKEEASAFFGKFMLSLVSHAIIDRAAVRESERKPVFIYIDEAHEYLDSVLVNLFNQARKYNVALTIAHQNLDQLGGELRSAIASSTSIKFAGSLSDKDARSMSGDMKCDPAFIHGRRKLDGVTDFALYIRNKTERAVSCTLALGRAKKEETLSERDIERLYERNREMYGTLPEALLPAPEIRLPIEPTDSLPSGLESPKTPRNIELKKVVLPKAAGKGGVEHRYLQSFVKKLAEEAGYRADIEAAVTGGFVDVLLRREGEVIAVEIAISTDVSYEVSNLEKCLSIENSKIMVVSTNEKHLKGIEKRAIERIGKEALERVLFLEPSNLSSYLLSITLPQQVAEKRIRGYKVKVRQANTTAEDAAARRRQVADVLVRSIQAQD